MASNGDRTNLYVFTRIHTRPGCGMEMDAALRQVLTATRQEPGCLGVDAFQATDDEDLYFIHSHWRDPAAFERHGTMAHTVRFKERVGKLLDQPFNVSLATLAA